MKITITALLITIISLNVTAQAPIDVKKVSLSSSFEKIEVLGNVRVVLTNAPSDELVFQGHRKDIAHIRSSVKKGKLVIDAFGKRTFEDLIIYVPITSARSLKVTGDAGIFSSEAIRINKLDIVLNGESFLNISHKGIVNIKAGDGYTLVR